MQDGVLVGKLGLGVLCLALLLVLGSSSRLRTLSDRRFSGFAFAIMAASRLAIFVGFFLILKREPQSDVVTYYYPQAKEVLAGHVPYRDFYSSYGPLFPYLEALAVWLWDTPKSLVLFAILVELSSFPLWLGVARASVDEPTTRLATLLYVTCPLPIMRTALNGENQVFCSILLALSLGFLLRKRAFASGLFLGASLVLVKFLGVLFAPPLFIGAGERRTRFLLGFFALPVLVLGGMAIAGIDVLTPLRAESKVWTSGNLPYFFSSFGLHAPDTVLTVILGGALAVVSLLALYAGVGREPAARLYLTTLLLLIFMLLSKKAYARYLVMGLFPICVTVASRPLGRAGLFAFGLAGAVATVEPSLWHRWAYFQDMTAIFRADAAAPRGKLLTVLVCEILLLISYAACVVRAYRLGREALTKKALA